MIVAMVSPDWQGCQGRTGWCCEAVLKRHALIDRNQCVVDDLDGAAAIRARNVDTVAAARAAADRRHRQGAIPVQNSALRRDKQRSVVLAPDVALSHGRPGCCPIQTKLSIDARNKHDKLTLFYIRINEINVPGADQVACSDAVCECENPSCNPLRSPFAEIRTYYLFVSEYSGFSA